MVGCTFTTCLSDEQYDYLKTKEKQTIKVQTDSNNEKDNEAAASSIAAVPSTDQTLNPNSSSNAREETSNPQTTTLTNYSNTNNLNRTNFNLRGHKADVI
jgi:hypothetical protein